MSDHDEHLPVLAQLEALRQAGDRKAWAKVRRATIVAPCCRRFSLVEVMNTEPVCALVRQVEYGRVDARAERRRWSGLRRADMGILWLSTFERMASRRAIYLPKNPQQTLLGYDVRIQMGPEWPRPRL